MNLALFVLGKEVPSMSRITPGSDLHYMDLFLSVPALLPLIYPDISGRLEIVWNILALFQLSDFDALFFRVPYLTSHVVLLSRVVFGRVNSGFGSTGKGFPTKSFAQNFFELMAYQDPDWLQALRILILI